jgi:uncharacterized protein YcbK (DUF882 family)/LysM repeat protein
MKSVLAPLRPLAAALGLLFSLTALASTSPAVAAPHHRSRPAADADEKPAEKIHVVASGHTLAKIAKRYKVSVADLRAANDISPGERLKPGTRLVIPTDGGSKRAKSRAAARDTDADRDRDRDREEDDRDPPRKKKKSSRETREAREAREDRDDQEDRDDGDDDRGRSSKSRKRGARDTDGKGYVRLVHGSESWHGKLTDKKGKLAPRTLDGFARILRSASTGKKHAIEPRLVSLIGVVSDHFSGRTIEVVSGFRPYTPTQATAHSRHNSGSAIDFHVKGVSNEELRDFCRTLRKVGVGYYPNNSFVHLDVRETATYWVDLSRSGEPPRYVKEGAKGGDSEGSGGEEHESDPKGETKSEKDAPVPPPAEGSKKTSPDPAPKP